MAVVGTEIFHIFFFSFCTHYIYIRYTYKYIKLLYYVSVFATSSVGIVLYSELQRRRRRCSIQYFNVNWHANVPILLILLSIRRRSNLMEISILNPLNLSPCVSLYLSLSFSLTILLAEIHYMKNETKLGIYI